MCPILTDPDNGRVECSLEDEVPTEGDTCIYVCDKGFDPSGGEITRECLSDGNWSGNDITCDRGMMLFDESKLQSYVSILSSPTYFKNCKSYHVVFVNNWMR